ncbi:MAG: UDP-N-acetylglucosamine--N-acetylmuramyl-(pentapeptide) pyrophosphoryl-undecaprenol N-acetylglucosamine transferase [bacterium]|nr:UDP-N-acetylglucosamine--N-acetylmuramyl-(pentapeptide) pyrophosphoryl-undecaprenol N-acetylglucosamine transferase [bacterium]
MASEKSKISREVFLENKRILLTAGGTGGHLFPALAVAKILKDRGYDVSFSSDPRGKRMLRDHGSEKLGPTVAYSCKTPAQKTILKKVYVWILLLGACFLETIRFFGKRPAVVLGFGGYATFPSLVAAWVWRCPIVLHEQNTYLGRVQRLFARHAKAVATSMPLVHACVTPQIQTGLPVRDAVRAAANKSPKYQPPSSTDHFNLLVLGGSQGAKSFSTLLPKAIGQLPQALKARLRIRQQCCAGQEGDLLEAYRNLGINHVEVATFFKDIAEQYTFSHLVLARAGASTLAEMMLFGRPGILIPYPYAADNHQWHNAQFLTQKEAGWMVEEKELDKGEFSEVLESLILNPEALMTKSVQVFSLATKQADWAVADLVEKHTKTGG